MGLASGRDTTTCGEYLHPPQVNTTAFNWGNLCNVGFWEAMQEEDWVQKGKAWPGDSQWTGRGQGPRASWGTTRSFTTSIISQGHIRQDRKSVV